MIRKSGKPRSLEADKSMERITGRVLVEQYRSHSPFERPKNQRLRQETVLLGERIFEDEMMVG